MVGGAPGGDRRCRRRLPRNAAARDTGDHRTWRDDLAAPGFSATSTGWRRRAADAAAVWRQIDLLLVPTTGTTYRIAEIEADPVALNENLGRYTNFINLLDLAAVAVPNGFRRNGLPDGVTLVGPAFHDPLLAAIGARFQHETGLPLGATGAPLPRLEPRAAVKLPLSADSGCRGASFRGATERRTAGCRRAEAANGPDIRANTGSTRCPTASGPAWCAVAGGAPDRGRNLGHAEPAISALFWPGSRRRSGWVHVILDGGERCRFSLREPLPSRRAGHYGIRRLAGLASRNRDKEMETA